MNKEFFRQESSRLNKKSFRRKAAAALCVLLLALCASGCGGTELENKTFPLAVIIAQQEGQHQVCYLAQQLSEVANERADGGNMTAANASGSTYYETHQSFEKNNRCQLDMTHTKAVIFQKGFLESRAFTVFLDTVRSENTYARNTLVYLSDCKMEEMAELNNTLEVPLGSYLEQMTENEREVNEQAFVTLGTLLNEQANASRTLLIPVLEVEHGLPAIQSYEVLQGFEAKGRVSAEAARIYYLLAGQMQRMDLFLDKEEQVKLCRIKCSRKFRMEDGTVTEQLLLKAEAARVTGKSSRERIERVLADQIVEICQEAKLQNGVDLTDSSRCLAMEAPEVYRAYGKQANEYRDRLVYEVQVQVRLV
ncbi:MAG: hypothetical protein K2N87_19925 [Eubacterium sp.]|nr:hypothetical protein [Eubacterium sp.]